ncbi:MAG: hypothetical protein ABSH56_02950 [Bryobacteraceae bacterium]|jgi:hypothetical protein
MSSSINSLSGYLQSILTSALKSSGSKTTTAASSATGTASASDSTHLSPFAQLMSTLQQLQQSNPTEYQQVTAQIATNLQNAAQTAQSDGNATAASQLNTLANDFTTASQTGQLPNIQDLAQAVSGGGHHHHHHSGTSDSDSSVSTSGSGSGTTSSGSSGPSTSTSSTSAAIQTLAQILAAFGANGEQNQTLNPLSIITSTLESAGIGSSNS